MVETVMSCLLKPITYMKPELLTTSCNLLAKAMINNCFTERETPTELLLNEDIYKLGGYYDTKRSEASKPT